MILSGRGGTFTYLMMMMMLWLKYACLCCLDDAIVGMSCTILKQC